MDFEALFGLLLVAIAVTLEPLPIVAFILLLSAERGIVKGLGFILGWVGCLVVVIGAVIFVLGGKPPKPQSPPTTAALIVKVLLGVILIGVAIRQRRHIGEHHDPPSWMARLDTVSPLTAAGLAAFVQPWTLVAAGAATVIDSNLNAAGQWVGLILFCLIGTSSILLMELYAVFSPEASSARLDGLRLWIDNHRDQAIVILSLVVGLWLTATSLYQLVMLND